ncbi:MAG: alkaline phosphatase family protein [Methanotrichaceae archaeon]|nr:alkaline phosphatase family protein [Methanotrichaceae archaeon]
MKPVSLLDVAPTLARTLGISLPRSDGLPIEAVAEWGCRNAVLLIIDSLGYDLFRWLLPGLPNMSRLAKAGVLFKADAVSDRTTPAIASILSGLLPEHHGIYDKAGAKESSTLSLPEIASSCGLKTAVVMEKNGAEVYEGLIEIVRGIPDTLRPDDFDQTSCSMTLEALRQRPRLLVSYFIGIDKTVHMGLGPDKIREAVTIIDRCLGEIFRAAEPNTLIVICGDHPVHAGQLKRTHEPYCVALVMGKVGDLQRD